MDNHVKRLKPWTAGLTFYPSCWKSLRNPPDGNSQLLITTKDFRCRYQRFGSDIAKNKTIAVPRKNRRNPIRETRIVEYACNHQSLEIEGFFAYKLFKWRCINRYFLKRKNLFIRVNYTVNKFFLRHIDNKVIQYLKISNLRIFQGLQKRILSALPISIISNKL